MPSLGKKLPPAEPFPIGCGICGRKWEYVTEGINVPGHPRNKFGYGRLVPVHPAGPCVDRGAVKYAMEDDTPMRRCKQCKRWFAERGSSYCSDGCRDARREYDREYYHKRRKVAA